MTRPEKFAPGDFILQALRRQLVQVKGLHPVWRSYVSVELLMRLSWTLLARGVDERPGLQRTDACGNGQEVGDVAAAVAVVLEVDLGPRRLGAEPTDRFVGNGAASSALLQQHGLKEVGLSEQIRYPLGMLQRSGSSGPKTVDHF